MDALQNLRGVVNNQVLIREHEITDTDFRHITGDGSVLFIKYPHQQDDTNTYEFIDIFTLKSWMGGYRIYLLEAPVDDVTWLRIKQSGTYVIHFDLIIDPCSVSFELHTRVEIKHFSEHNPKHDINLEKGENCLLVWKQNPDIY